MISRLSGTKTISKQYLKEEREKERNGKRFREGLKSTSRPDLVRSRVWQSAAFRERERERARCLEGAMCTGWRTHTHTHLLTLLQSAVSFASSSGSNNIVAAIVAYVFPRFSRSHGSTKTQAREDRSCVHAFSFQIPLSLSIPEAHLFFPLPSQSTRALPMPPTSRRPAP